MSTILNQLATIEVSNEAAHQLDLAGIYAAFCRNYRKLDDLKGFRSEYDKKNWMMRWWHNDQLRDAQLDSAEVQGEFSKTIGQLMLISIMQSRKLVEQQATLTEQQQRLMKQAAEIAENTGALQAHHHTLADQSSKLQTVVEDFFKLESQTKDWIDKLLVVAREVRAIRDSLVQHVDERTRVVTAQCRELADQVSALSEELEQQTKSCMSAVQDNANHQYSQHAAIKTNLSHIAMQLDQQTSEQLATAAELRQCIEQIGGEVASANGELAACMRHQQNVQGSIAELQTQMSQQMKKAAYIAAGVAAVGTATLFSVAHLLM